MYYENYVLECKSVLWNGELERKKWYYVEPKDRIPYMNYVILFVREFLSENKDSIVILQESPGKTMAQSLYGTFKAAFSSEKYEFYEPQTPKDNENFQPRVNTQQLTVAITNKDASWTQKNDFLINTQKFYGEEYDEKKKGKDFFENRYIELSYKPNNKEILRVLGVHMPIGKKSKKEEKKTLDQYFWNTLAEYTKDKTNEKFIIIGDFNAYSGAPGYGDEYNKVLNQLNNINKDNVDAIPQDIKTFIHTPVKKPIDHVLRTNMVKIKNAEVLCDINLSDHRPIIAEIDLNEKDNKINQ